MFIFKSGKPKLLLQADRLGYNYKSVLDSIPNSFNEKIGYTVWNFWWGTDVNSRKVQMFNY